MKITGKKKQMQEYIEEKEKNDLIYVCPKCFGYAPCWCGNKEYIGMWEFVYKAFLSCKPSI